MSDRQPATDVLIYKQSASERASPTSANKLVSALLSRPPEITKAIDDNFKQLISDSEVGYVFTGTVAYGFLAGIKTDELINALRAESSEQKKILDVGTGNGMFLNLTSEEYGDAISMYGLSANDFRKTDFPLPPGIDYRTSNAEYLLDLYGKDQFDLIVSARTVMHLIDPLGTIAQMYEVLKPNGVLAIDSFTLFGIEDRLPDLISALQQSGYEVVADYDYRDNGGAVVSKAFSGLFIRKTVSHPHLELPVIYNGLTDKGRAKYALAWELPQEPKILPEATEDFITNVRELHPWTFEGEVKNLEALAKVLQHDPDAITQKKEEDAFIDLMLNNSTNDFSSLQVLQNAMSEAIKAGEGWRRKNEDTVRQMKELKERIPVALGAWLVKYRNDRKFVENIKQRLKLQISNNKERF